MRVFEVRHLVSNQHQQAPADLEATRLRGVAARHREQQSRRHDCP